MFSTLQNRANVSAGLCRLYCKILSLSIELLALRHKLVGDPLRLHFFMNVLQSAKEWARLQYAGHLWKLTNTDSTLLAGIQRSITTTKMNSRGKETRQDVEPGTLVMEERHAAFPVISFVFSVHSGLIGFCLCLFKRHCRQLDLYLTTKSILRIFRLASTSRFQACEDVFVQHRKSLCLILCSPLDI